MADALSQFFRGYAKVELKHLEFQFSLFDRRVFDPSNSKVLREKFENDECARGEPQNFIGAVVNNDLLEQTIAESDTDLSMLKDETALPWLSFPEETRILCLYGKHRVEAAKHALPPGDRWWSLAFYSEDLPDHLRRRLCMYRDPHFNSGDIFRNWRHCELTGKVESTFWQSMMSLRSRKDIKSLKEAHPDVMRCLDRLIDFPGLWVDFSFTFIRRILEIGCPKEVAYYLSRIHEIWSSAFQASSASVDVQSTHAIENLMPRQSRIDCSLITQLMDDGSLFPSITRTSDRETLLINLTNIHGRILTLHSMIQDTLLWHPCSRALKQLIPGRAKDLRHSILSNFHCTGMGWPVQVSESVVECKDANNFGRQELQSQRVTSAYVQLWFFAIRHVESLTKTTLARHQAHKNETHAFRATQRETNNRLALLARNLGFQSTTIDRLCGDTTLRPNVKAYLLGRRPRDIYELPARWEERVSSKVLDYLRPLEERKDFQLTIPSLTSEAQLPRQPKRCGLPFYESHQKDRQSLFLPHIYCPDQPIGEFPSSFSIMRDMIFSFLGRDMFPIESHSPSDPSSPVMLEPHPPGTPTNYTHNETTMEKPSNVQLERGLSDDHEIVIYSPIAAGFEDNNCIAPLNQIINIFHHRGANDILETWFQSHNKSLAVCFFFKKRQYIKFRLNDPNIHQQVEGFLLSIANNHYIADIHKGFLNWEDALQNIHEQNLLLVFTGPEHQKMAKDFWAYVCSFDAQTGKRHDRGFDEEGEDLTPVRKKHMGQILSIGNEESEY